MLLLCPLISLEFFLCGIRFMMKNLVRIAIKNISKNGRLSQIATKKHKIREDVTIKNQRKHAFYAI
jgi:hypothetical protein